MESSTFLACSESGTSPEQVSSRPAWQIAMQNAIRSVPELLNMVQLQASDLDADLGTLDFPVFVPRELAQRMRAGDPRDPILLQVLATNSERAQSAEFQSDPVGDLAVEAVPGLLHKYTGRVLLVASGKCAVHCRYCFRRHFPYETLPKSQEQWRQAIEYIASDETIEEVILSGGDPLSLGNDRLADLMRQFESIEHLQRVRVHTRFPVVIPQRIDDGFCRIFSNTRLSSWFVFHINHANEIDRWVATAAMKLKKLGATLLNQAVLLRGINDTLKAQFDLAQRLVNTGIVPYYLHQLDRVQGASHFEASPIDGLRIIEAMRKVLPGYAVPQYVREVAGEPHKMAMNAERM